MHLGKYTGLHITKHPQFPPRVKYGDYVAIFVSAVGDQKSLRYSWKFNGGDINLASSTGSNTRILVIKSCSIEHQGTYTCIVSNSRGEIESNPAHLTLGKHSNVRLAQINVLTDKLLKYAVDVLYTNYMTS